MNIEKAAKDIEVKENKLSPEDVAASARVESQQITLVDNKGEEYEFLVLDEIPYLGADYLALVSCDEKDKDAGNESLDGSMNDITVVEKRKEGDDFTIYPVSDLEVLRALSDIIEKKYGHLNEKK